jgi:hypothetical protein
MAHDWKPWTDPTKSPAWHFMRGPLRRCAHCGAVQTKESQHSWGRVVGYRWFPLAGRCKPAEPVSESRPDPAPR